MSSDTLIHKTNTLRNGRLNSSFLCSSCVGSDHCEGNSLQPPRLIKTASRLSHERSSFLVMFTSQLFQMVSATLAIHNTRLPAQKDTGETSFAFWIVNFLSLWKHKCQTKKHINVKQKSTSTSTTNTYQLFWSRDANICILQSGRF